MFSFNFFQGQNHYYSNHDRHNRRIEAQKQNQKRQKKNDKFIHCPKNNPGWDIKVAGNIVFAFIAHPVTPAIFRMILKNTATITIPNSTNKFLVLMYIASDKNPSTR